MIRAFVDFALSNRLLIVLVPHLDDLRSVSIFGLSSLSLIFDENPSTRVSMRVPSAPRSG
jgi:hypothetical protein